MEGSRHEKATLVGLAYGIGMLTAFIWLGINDVELPSNNIDLSAYQNTASVIDASTPEAPVAAPVISSKQLVTYQDGLLEYSAIDGVRLLSFNPEVSGNTVSEDFKEQGYHYGNIAYVANASEEYVFFCEVKSVEAETCRPFVYDALTDSIYPVRKNGNLVDLLVSAASTVAWNGSNLTIGTDTSTNPAKPWLLGS